MVDWKGFMLPFISSLLGSSLIVSMVTNVMQTWNKPDIFVLADRKYDKENEFKNVQGNPEDTNSVSQTQYGLSDRSEGYHVYEITIKNKGTASAESLYITLSHPRATDKIDVKTVVEPVDMKDWEISEDGKMATSNLSRLAPGARLTVQSTYPTVSSVFDETCTITVAYRDGFKEDDPCSPAGLGSEWGQELFIIPLIVSGTVAGGLLTFREVRKRIKYSRKDKFVQDLIREVKRFQDKVRLKNSAQSIFNSKLWDSKGINERREIFNNYDDYKKIENYYDCVNRRHSAFLQKDINDEMIEKHNNECLNSADTVSQIDWKKYGIDTMSINKSSAIVKVLVGSILITYACEGGLFFIHYNYLFYNVYESSEAFVIILFLSRGIASFLILIPILRTSHLIYGAQSDSKKSNLLQIVRHSKLGLSKLLLASIAVMGISIFIIFFSVIEILGMYELANVIPNPYYIIAIDTPADALRMLLMVFVIPRRIIRMKGTRIRQVVLSRIGLKHTNRIL